jgi:hypothetical protein
MTKNETISLIIQNMVNYGIEDDEQFVDFCTMILPMMSTEELQEQLVITKGLIND